MKSNHCANLIDLNDFSKEQWEEIIRLAKDIMKNPHIYENACRGKIMATLFYEPSTRTQMSFQSAMMRLGGGVIGFDNPAGSSVAKGENLKDTTKIASTYADIMVIRHPLEGAAKAAALSAECPVINGGDGGHLHPTQTLTDLLTLSQEKKRLDNLTVGVCGDLKNGRTVHSLLKALSHYSGNQFILISTPELAVPEYIKIKLKEKGCQFKEVNSIEEVIDTLDVLYMTRIQRERFASEQEYKEQKDIFILDNKKLIKAKRDLIILHPLPRVDEIAVEVDDDPRAFYFKQAMYGMYVRMALILMMLNYNMESKPLLESIESSDLRCNNPRCITRHERYLPSSFRKTDSEPICVYCDRKITDFTTQTN